MVQLEICLVVPINCDTVILPNRYQIKIYQLEMDTSVHQITSIGMLIAALSVIAPNWKPSKHTSTVEWINKLQYIHTTERYGAMRTHMRQPHTAIMDGSQEHHSE